MEARAKGARAAARVSRARRGRVVGAGLLGVGMVFLSVQAWFLWLRGF
jgi:hypothetical protein